MLELPSHNVSPLVQSKGKISVTLDPVGISGIHDGLTGGPNGNRFCKIALAWLRDPSNLGSETLNVLFFSLECLFGNKHREVSIFDSMLFYEHIEESLNIFPNSISPGPQDVTAWDIIIIEHARFVNNVSVPTWEIFLFLRFNTQQIYLLFATLLFLFFFSGLLFNLRLLSEIYFFIGNFEMV